MKKFLAALLAAMLLFAAAPAFAVSLDDTALSSYTPDELLQLWNQIGDLLRADGNYPYVELEQGNTGYDVFLLQTRLTELGYYHKEIVDYFGNGTYSAMRAFEQANGLRVNGVASVSDQQVLFSDAAVAYSGQSVSGSTTTVSVSQSRSDDRDATSAATSDSP